MGTARVLPLVVQKGPCEILEIRVDINIERRLILIDVAFGNRDLDNVVDDVIILLERVSLFLNLWVISQVRQLLEPVVELFGLVDLATPSVDQVEVVVEEVARFLLGPDDEVVLALLEEPFGLTLFEQHAAFFDLVQLDNVARRVRELALALVRYQHALDRVDVDEPRVSVHAQPVHLLDRALEPFEGEEALVGLLVLAMLLHLSDHIVELIVVLQVHVHEDLKSQVHLRQA